jgi:hypothetical protein
MKSNMGLIMNIALGIVGGDCQRDFQCLRHKLRLRRRRLTDLDRPRRTTGLWTSEARSAGGVPTVRKRNRWPSYPVVVCCFGELRIW